MKVSQINLVLLLWFSINFVSGEQFYIVISPDSPCPTREQGEPWHYILFQYQILTQYDVIQQKEFLISSLRECWDTKLGHMCRGRCA